MPSSFPFLRLPFLIQLLILENASLLELFKFSLISKRSKQIVKSLDFKLSMLHWDFDDYMNYRKLELRYSEDYKVSISSKLHQLYLQLEGFIPSGELTFNGNVMSVYCKDGLDRLGIESEMTMNESLELMEQFTKYFLELFNVSKYDLTLSSFSNLRDCFVWKYTKHFENIEVSDCTLSSDDLKFILEELTIEDKLSIETPVEEGFEYSGPLKMRKLLTENTNWLTLEAVLNMDCEHLVLHRTTFNYQDLNAIIRKWMDGGLENLKEVRIEEFNPVPHDSKDIKLDHILEGIESFPWDIKNRPKEDSEYNFEDGRDIRRGDGRLATVDYFVGDRYLGNMFFFHVWDTLSVVQ